MLDNSRPPDAPATNSHNGAGPNRRVAAPAATPIASNASTGGEPRDPIGPSPASRRWANEVNTTRISSACDANRRSHPRTVSGCTPAPAATTRRLAPSR